MPTITTGLFFVAKDQPGRAASSMHNDNDGTFVLKLRLVDNQGPQRVEAYVVRWSGEEAHAWWCRHGPLRAGAALQLELVNPRSFPGLRSPEIHANVSYCRLLPPRAPASPTTSTTPMRPEAAQPGALNHAS